MRMSLPIIWCFSDEASKLLTSLRTTPAPKLEWVEWGKIELELFREIAKPPKHLKRIVNG